MNRLALNTTIVTLVFFTVAATAQKENFTPPELLNTPGIFIPDEAARTGLGGLVRVRISIDDRGDVTRVEEVTGPGWTCPQVSHDDVLSMRDAATKAAMLAKFNPATQNRTPVTSSTSLNFDFPADESTEARTISAGSPDLRKQAVNGRSIPAAKTAGTVIAAKRSERVKASQRIKPPRQISGGVLNGKALSLVKPRWPEVAHGTSGTVTVSVVIDTNGDVFSAETVSGHPLFRFAARSGACQSKFAPTTLSSGESVRVYGVIVYNFRQL